ncbi:MAG: SRPBCC family protein [Pseudomonadota bacterium]
MTEQTFDLISHWAVPARIETVAEILAEPERFPDWWGAVYLSIEIADPGDADGIGRTVDVHSRGWLPYTLRWTGRLVERDPPHRAVIEATGDLTGHGVWSLRQNGDIAEITYTWTVVTSKPWMRLLAPVLRPVFAWNHRWAMAQGEAGLIQELARRAADGPTRAGQGQGQA